MKINTELDIFETETLLDLLRSEIVTYRQDSKLRLLAKEISLTRHEWNLQYAKHLEKIKDKLLEFDMKERGGKDLTENQ